MNNGAATAPFLTLRNYLKVKPQPSGWWFGLPVNATLYKSGETKAINRIDVGAHPEQLKFLHMGNSHQQRERGPGEYFD